MSTPSSTLKSILGIIAKDVKAIKKKTGTASKPQQLPPEDAQTLCRYASTLDGISETEEKESAKMKKSFDKKSTEELIEQYQKDKK